MSFKRSVFDGTKENDEEIEFVSEKMRRMSRSKMNGDEDEWSQGKGGKVWRHILRKKLKKGKRFSKRP